MINTSENKNNIYLYSSNTYKINLYFNLINNKFYLNYYKLLI